jgi:hypothetical protein
MALIMCNDNVHKVREQAARGLGAVFAKVMNESVDEKL